MLGSSRRGNQHAAPSPTTSRTRGSFDDAIIISDSDDEIERNHSWDDRLSGIYVSSTAKVTQKETSSPPFGLSPSSALTLDDSRSTTTLDRSYATSMTSHTDAISDGTITSLSSDEDSDAPNAIDAGLKTPQRTIRSLPKSQLASTPLHQSEETKQEPSLAASLTLTPSRRSARIVSSGSSVQKALQRRDELDAKLTATPRRRKPEAPEAPVLKRPRGRPRKSAPELSVAQSSGAQLEPLQTTASSSKLQSASTPVSSRRSARLSVPSSLSASALASYPGGTPTKPTPSFEAALPPTRTPQAAEGRHSRGLNAGSTSLQVLASPSASTASSAAATPISRSTVKDVTTAGVAGSVVSSVPIKRGPGRPRKSDSLLPSVVVKRRPGRPRKSDSAVLTAPVKRGPGRPRKSNSVVSAVPVKRGPGRPRKSDSLVLAVPVKRGPGRPRKSDSVVSNVLPVKRGPGRPRKTDNTVSPASVAPKTTTAQQSQDAMTTRSRKRSLSSAGAIVAAGPSLGVVEDEQQTPRRKRGRPARKSLGLAGETTVSVDPAGERTAFRANTLSRKEAIDLLDDGASDLSDGSDLWSDSPEQSQHAPQSTQRGAARRGRPPLASTSEARKLKRASKQDKDGKTYHVSGLYAGEADAVASTSLHSAEKRNTILPAPIHFGAKLLYEERDFRLPFAIYQKMEELRDRVNAKRKPPRYQQISKNKYYSRPKLQGEVPLCNCKPGSGCGADCINRMLMFICDPRTCPSGSNCTNISLGRRPTVKTTVAYYGRRGFGLKTLEAIKKGDFIDEYRGEVINLSEAGKRVTEEYKATGNYYLLDYDAAAGELLDGGRKGNITRFANHSCEPNCRIEKFIICGTDEALSAEFQIGLFANRDIEAGEELTYNYGWAAFQPRDITGAPTAEVPLEQCLCGAANCLGILGGKKAPATKARVSEVAANSRKKTAKSRGRGKGKARKAGKQSRARLRAMTPVASAACLSAAAISSASLAKALGRPSRKRPEAQSSLLNKIVIKRRERTTQEGSQSLTSNPMSVNSIPTAANMQDGQDGTLQTSKTGELALRSKRLASIAPTDATVPQPSGMLPEASAYELEMSSASTSQTNAPSLASTSGPAATNEQAIAGPVVYSNGSTASTGRTPVRLPLLDWSTPSRPEHASGRALTTPRGKAMRGKKDRRWSAAEANVSDNDDSSSWEESLSDFGSPVSDFQKQDDEPQQHPASQNTAGQPGRRGRHKLQLSSEEAERRSAERRARNAFLARVRRASKRGILIQDPTQHPLKKISIQCTAAPENTYIPDLPSSLVTLGMTTADARRARNAFLARVRRAVKRGYPKDVAIKMAAKPLPGDAATDTPVMKAQRAYMEQLEREAVNGMPDLVENSVQRSEIAPTEGADGQAPTTASVASAPAPAAPSAVSTTTAASAGNDGWVDETGWRASL